MENLTIIIPFYNGHEHIQRLVKSIPSDIPVIIIDDMSDQPLQDSWTSRDVIVDRLAIKGYFGGAVNHGIKLCETDVLILNQDTWFTNDSWQNVLKDNRDEYAFIGEGIRMGEGVRSNKDLYPHGYIHGTFMFMRRDAINEVGLLNDELYPLWGSTAEWQIRISRKGYAALPITKIAGWEHKRPKSESYGSSIKQLLNNTPDQAIRERLLHIPTEISVIIPCHGIKYARKLVDALASLVGGKSSMGDLPGQTFQSFDVIIIHDSVKSREEITLVQDYIGKESMSWKCIRQYELKRKAVDSKGVYTGKPSALNAGIQKSHSKYITVLDADDMMKPDRLERLWEMSQQHPHSVIYDDLQFFRDGKIIEMKVLDAMTSVLTTREYNFEELLFKNSMPIGIFYPLRAWQEVGGYSPEMKYGREDWAFNIGLGQKGWCGVKIRNYSGYLYRRDTLNRTIINTTPTWWQKFYRQVQQLYPDLYRGERPMGCCGNTNPKPRNRNKKNKAQVFPGQKGMTSIILLTNRAAAFTIYGAITTTKYRIQPGQPFYVDNQDLDSFLDIMDGTKQQFALYGKTLASSPKPKTVQEDSAESVPLSETKPSPEIKPATEKLEIVSIPSDTQDTDERVLVLVNADEAIEVSTDMGIDPTYILSTVNNLSIFINEGEYTHQDLLALMQMELDNKKRKTAISLIEKGLELYKDNQDDE